jgi:hypothetical protein
MGVVVTKKKDDLDSRIEKATNAKMAVHFAQQVRSIEDKIADLNRQREILIKQAGELVCPFKPGQVLLTTKGLGANGLDVMEYVVPGTNPGSGFTPDNRWAIYCLSRDKHGNPTKRFVVISEERYRDGTFGEVKVK